MLIPFIDQDRLLAAAASVSPERLTPEERQRNTLGDILVFSHAPGGRGGLGRGGVGWGGVILLQEDCGAGWWGDIAPGGAQGRLPVNHNSRHHSLCTDNPLCPRPPLSAPGADAETEFCASTLPAHFASVVAPNSRAVAQAAPPPLPTGDRGFVPEVRGGLLGPWVGW